MILTTTPSVEGRTITRYHGIVFGEVISGVDSPPDFPTSSAAAPIPTKRS